MISYYSSLTYVDLHIYFLFLGYSIAMEIQYEMNHNMKARLFSSRSNKKTTNRQLESERWPVANQPKKKDFDIWRKRVSQKSE